MKNEKYCLIVRTAVAAMILAGMLGCTLASADNDFFDEEGGKPIYELYINENSEEYKALGTGEKLFTASDGNKISTYRIKSDVDCYLSLLLTEEFAPYSGYRYVLKKYEYEIEKDKIYEIDVVKPYKQYSSQYSYEIYHGWMEGVDIPCSYLNQSEVKLIVVENTLGGDWFYPSPEMKEVSFCKVRAWAVPANGMKKNDPRFIWGSIITALRDIDDKSYKIGEGLYYGGKEFDAIPGWVARAAMKAMFPEIKNYPPFPSEITLDVTRDMYIISKTDEFHSSSVKYNARNIELVDVKDISETQDDGYRNATAVILKSGGKTKRVEISETDREMYSFHSTGDNPFDFSVRRIIE